MKLFHIVFLIFMSLTVSGCVTSSYTIGHNMGNNIKPTYTCLYNQHSGKFEEYSFETHSFNQHNSEDFNCTTEKSESINITDIMSVFDMIYRNTQYVNNFISIGIH